MEVLAIVAALALSAGVAAGIFVAATPRSDPAGSTASAIDHELSTRWSVRSFLRSRLRRGVATGLALTVGLIVVVLAGLFLGVLIYMVRTQTGLVYVDRVIADWTAQRMTDSAATVLEDITFLGSTIAVVILGCIVAAFAVWRWRSWSIPLFLLLVIGGQWALSNIIKIAVQRARPDLHPLAGFSGPSFPSGHTTAAAATFVALALVVGRDRTPWARSVLAGLAVGLAVAVGCSRVFLGVHWLSDVLGGLVLGWAWVAICAVLFGGRVMRFASPVQEATNTIPVPSVDLRDADFPFTKDIAAAAPHPRKEQPQPGPHRSSRCLGNSRRSSLDRQSCG